MGFAGRLRILAVEIAFCQYVCNNYRMKLLTVEVSNYKSVRRSNPFNIGDITCLVGKNEAGKTALLEALYRLNPVVPQDAKFDVTDDYPRSDVTDYEHGIETKKLQPATVVKAVFALDVQTDLREVSEKFGDSVIPADGETSTPTLTLSRGYANKLYYDITIDESAAVKALVVNAQLPQQIGDEAARKTTLKELADYLSQQSERQVKEYTEANSKAQTIADATQKAKAVDTAKALAETEGTKQLRGLLTEVLKVGIREHIWDQFLKVKVPKFLYFDEYYQMEGAVNLEKLKERLANPGQLLPPDRPMLGLIDLARLNIDQLISPDRTQSLINKLEGASNHLSRQVLKYWSQNKHIQLQFDVRTALPNDPPGMQQGHNLWGKVYDSAHQVSTALGVRSRGFVWFFSFLAWYSQQRKTQERLILLLDEPGLFLHASAQDDFLRYIEAELKDHQVIYTTHSPFLVDAKHFDRVRIVEDKSMETEKQLSPDEQGTKVSTDILHVSKGTLFPLQGALGYEIAQTLFIGPNSLIVEGVSDLMYLQTMSSLLSAMGRESLRKEWVITPVGGADKVPTFAALIGIQAGMNVATLIDFKTKDRQSIENLYKEKLLNKTHVLTFHNFTGTSEADIEDMFEPDFYLGLVNNEYNKEISMPLNVGQLPEVGHRIIPRIETLLKKSDIALNHYRPARYFADNLSKLEVALSTVTLDRFEQAFIALNKLL